MMVDHLPSNYIPLVKFAELSRGPAEFVCNRKRAVWGSSRRYVEIRRFSRELHHFSSGIATRPLDENGAAWTRVGLFAAVQVEAHNAHHLHW